MGKMKYILQIGRQTKRHVITEREFIQLEVLMGFIPKVKGPATLGFTKRVNGAEIKAWPMLTETKPKGATK